MNPVATSSASPVTPLESLYGLIAEELQQVERILRSRLRSRDAYVDELIRYGCLLGGKRLRPALLLLSAKAVGEIEAAHCTLATVVEMIHTATLVHDDVLDDATTRRHLATVNSRWDNEASILLGDFLFSQAFYLASSLDDVFACRAIGRATNIVCEGELRQKGSRGDFELSEVDYCSIIEAKTAELCACSCVLGAHYAHANPPVLKHLDSYGRFLGIAFQIADDILDVVGREETTGKSLGTDLQQQKPTLPLIRLLQVADASTRDEVQRLVTGDCASAHATLRELMQRYDTVSYAEQQARQFAAMAAEQLDGLPGREAVEVLHSLTDFVVRRSA
ncbi:MAG: polyprenyl synthetase family protein [Planctomycetes bacterium]|nr:polyprenyl synthetase family protein [Planctomycetota bacterium]